MPGLTRHHHQQQGRMQLVEKIHRKTHHTGGRVAWGGGNKISLKGSVNQWVNKLLGIINEHL
ncbi:HNH endonuclease [Kroppenstedtia eburnea]|uniref:HNH endonuclease n=1 Tax=Kroppenstedtia eburnea TaxID=714067 RepID=UPI00362B834F